MAYQISVIVAADGTTSPLRLISSLDAQTLSTDDFEVILLDRGLGDAQRNSLRRVAARRPNIRIVDEGEDWRTDAGEYVLRAQPGQGLFPEALARLGGFAREHSLDVVAGRPVQPRQALSDPFLTDQPRLGAAQVPAALQSTVLLARRERVGATGAPARVNAADTHVGVLASYPASDDPAPSMPEGEGTARCDAPTLRWEDGDLVVALSGSLEESVSESGGDSADPVGHHKVTAVVRHLGSRLSYLLPTEITSVERPHGAVGGATWQTTIRLNPLNAAAGQPLPPGTWELDVVVSGDGRACKPGTVPTASAAIALLQETVVAVGASKKDALQIDVGPTRLPVLRDLNPGDAAVTESARGSELAVRLPELHVHNARALSGQLGLGRLLLPAKIEVIDGVAWLTGFVSGLAGEVPLSAKFGRSPQYPLGISLSIAGSGRMSVISTPAATAPPKPAPDRRAAATKTKPKRARKKSAKGPVAKLRRALPERLEPLVRRLADQPMARKIYRRLTGLSR